LDEENKEKVE